MKRFAVIAMVMTLVLSMAAVASAEVKFGGAFIVEFNWQGNTDLQEDAAAGNNDANFVANQRIDVVTTFQANDNLSATLYLRNQGTWGTAQTVGDRDTGMPLGGEDSTLGVRRAYLDFTWPDTDVKVRAGFAGFANPAEGLGNVVLDEEVAQVMVSAPLTENVSVALAWARVFNDATGTGVEADESQIDMAYLSIPMTFDGFKVTPWGMAGIIGDNVSIDEADGFIEGVGSTNATTAALADNLDSAYWLGLAFSMEVLDPFMFHANVNYGSVSGDLEDNDRSGWMANLLFEYTGFESVTPQLFAIYSSGEDGNASDGDGSERMPTIDGGYGIDGSLWLGGEWGLTGQNYENADLAGGFWAIGARAADFTFMDGLTHSLLVMYAQGTNDEDVATQIQQGTVTINSFAYGNTLTDEDSVWEVALTNKYAIYDELSLFVEGGFASFDYDEDVWGNGLDGGTATKVSVGLKYAF